MQPSNQEETSRRGDEKGGYGRGESKRRELAKLGRGAPPSLSQVSENDQYKLVCLWIGRHFTEMIINNLRIIWPRRGRKPDSISRLSSGTNFNAVDTMYISRSFRSNIVHRGEVHGWLF